MTEEEKIVKEIVGGINEAMLENFLGDHEDRLVEFTDTEAYIKRTYTREGIVYECSIDNTIDTYTSTDDVTKWFNRMVK